MLHGRIFFCCAFLNGRPAQHNRQILGACHSSANRGRSSSARLDNLVGQPGCNSRRLQNLCLSGGQFFMGGTEPKTGCENYGIQNSENL